MTNIRMIFIMSIRIILFIFIGLLLVVVSNNKLIELNQWWSIIISFVNIITIIVLFRLARKENISYAKLINWNKNTINLKHMLLMVFAIFFIGMLGMFSAGYFVYNEFPYLAEIMIKPIPFWLALLNAFILPLTTTLAEDGLYLGYSINRINNKWLAIFLPAFFYAFQHSFIPLLFDYQYIAYRFLSFLPLTILFCFWYYKKKDLKPIMIGHFLLNTATVIQIIFSSVK